VGSWGQGRRRRGGEDSCEYMVSGVSGKEWEKSVGRGEGGEGGGDVLRGV